ncbi:ester cyclase [Mariniflexile sp.]|uniref:ester cyclase n=1 Tax=Mariniflexile sp. TaxID=1979402 RepID=UPI004047B924
MKNLSLLVLAAILFTACQNQPQRYTQSSPEIETFKAVINDYDTKNYESLVSYYADTSKTNFNKVKMASKDIPEFHKQNDVNYSERGFAKDGQEFEMVLDDEGKTWVNFWGTWKATLAANGKEFTMPVHLTARFIDGKIVEDYGYWDPSEVIMALQEIEAVNNMGVDEKAIYNTIKNMITVWNKNDQEAMKAISVPNLIRNANGARVASNQEEYGAMMTAFFTGFPDFKVILEDTKIKDNKAIITWRCTGTNTGEFLGNPPTNKKTNIQGMSIWTFNSDGKAVQEDAYFDNLTMFQQLGYKEVPSI